MGAIWDRCNMNKIKPCLTTLVLKEISATNLFCSNITLLLMILISALYNSFLWLQSLFIRIDTKAANNPHHNFKTFPRFCNLLPPPASEWTSTISTSAGPRRALTAEQHFNFFIYCFLFVLKHSFLSVLPASELSQVALLLSQHFLFGMWLDQRAQPGPRCQRVWCHQCEVNVREWDSWRMCRIRKSTRRAESLH